MKPRCEAGSVPVRRAEASSWGCREQIMTVLPTLAHGLPLLPIGGSQSKTTFSPIIIRHLEAKPTS